MIAIDIDYFKKINDNYGHHIGDLALQHFAAIANRSIRTEDTIGRIGGEEFAVLLPNANAAAAQCMGERLRKTTESEPFKKDDITINFTISVGISVLSEKNSIPTTMINEADKALYDAKGAGRNCVILYKP